VQLVVILMLLLTVFSMTIMLIPLDSGEGFAVPTVCMSVFLQCQKGLPEHRRSPLMIADHYRLPNPSPSLTQTVHLR